MSLPCFKQLLQFLAFDNRETKDDRYKKDKMAACREVFEIFNDNCGKYLMPSPYVTIDECLYSYRNQISWKQYNKNKPKSYRLNFRCLNNVEYTFTYSSEVFCGKPQVIDEENGFYCSTILGWTIRLLEKFGWEKLFAVNLTTDNLYTYVALKKEVESHNMTFIGTMRSNRKGVTVEMLKKTNRDEFTNVVWFEKYEGKWTLTSYCVHTKSKGKKIVLILSNYPNLPTMGVTKDEVQICNQQSL